MKPDYLTYDAEALAQEQPFIAWVKRGEGAQAWREWLAEHPEQEAKLAAARQLVQAIDFAEARPSSEQRERMWANIEQSTREAEDVEARVVPLWKRPAAWLSAAASVALLVLAGWWLWQNAAGPEQLATQAGEREEYKLPDGSRVTLNAATQLSYKREEWRNRRAVDLAGEAFFEVKEGARFLVNTDYGSVEVLGTSFNVEARPRAFAVHCFTGKVRVRYAGQDTVLLPGQGSRLQNGRLATELFEGEKAAAWRTGVHHFESVPLREVFAELERQFGYQVDYPPAVAERRYTGFFESGTLPEALQAVCWPMKLEYEIQEEEESVIIK
jgi:transmembrane sensor